MEGWFGKALIEASSLKPISKAINLNIVKCFYFMCHFGALDMPFWLPKSTVSAIVHHIFRLFLISNISKQSFKNIRGQCSWTMFNEPPFQFRYWRATFLNGCLRIFPLGQFLRAIPKLCVKKMVKSHMLCDFWIPQDVAYLKIDPILRKLRLHSLFATTSIK